MKSPSPLVIQQGTTEQGTNGIVGKASEIWIRPLHSSSQPETGVALVKC